MSDARGLGSSIELTTQGGVYRAEHRPAEQSDNNFPAGHKEFCDNVWQIMDEIGNLLITKQLDYGPGNINNAHGGPINGLLVRIGDKFERLKNLVKKQQIKPQHEPIEDSFKDLANYGVIGLMIQRGLWPKG